MRCRAVTRAGLIGIMLLCSVSARAAPPEPNWTALPATTLERIAVTNQVNLSEVRSREAKIAILRDAWQQRGGLTLPADMASQLAEASSSPRGAGDDLGLPPAELFRPRIPDLRDDNPLTRLYQIGLYAVGAFGTGVFIYGLFKGAALVMETIMGKRSRADAIQQLLTYGVAWVFLMALLRGSIYGFLRAVFEFASASMWV